MSHHLRWAIVLLAIFVVTSILILHSDLDIPKHSNLKFLFNTHVYEDTIEPTLEEDYSNEEILNDEKLVAENVESEKQQNSEAVPVCVVWKRPNVRVMSFFVSSILSDMGAKFKFILSSNLVRRFRELEKAYKESGVGIQLPFLADSCTSDMPVVNLYFAEDSETAYRADAVNIVVGDEKCSCSPLNKGCLNADFRQFHGSQMSTDWLPLGPRFEFKQVEEVDVSSKRSIPFNFMGAMTSSSRRSLQNLLINPEIKSRYPFVAKGLTLFTSKWSKIAVGKYSCPSEYRDILLKSAFTLCPEGTNAESYRIYEAIESGSIPVLVHSKKSQCLDPYEQLISDGTPIIVLDSWDEFPAKVSFLLNHPEELDLLQASLRSWRSKFWTRITNNVENALERKYPIIFKSVQASINEVVFDENVSAKDEEIPTEIASEPKEFIPLVTGCGRSGTLTIKDTLSALGIPSVHEGAAPGSVSVSWLYAAYNAHKFPFEKTKSIKFRQAMELKAKDGLIFKPVVHLVRHPLKVISSTRRCFCGKGSRATALAVRNNRKSWAFVQAQFPEIDPKSELFDITRSALYWLRWNQLIDRNFPGNTLVTLEGLNPRQLAEALGMNNDEAPTSLPPRDNFHTSPEAMKNKVPDVTWKDLHTSNETTARSIFELAQTYGYEVGLDYDSVII